MKHICILFSVRKLFIPFYAFRGKGIFLNPVLPVFTMLRKIEENYKRLVQPFGCQRNFDTFQYLKYSLHNECSNQFLFLFLNFFLVSWYCTPFHSFSWTNVSLHSFLDGYSDKDIVFHWENKSNRIAIGEKVRTLPQYNLTKFETHRRFTQYVVGKSIVFFTSHLHIGWYENNSNCLRMIYIRVRNVPQNQEARKIQSKYKAISLELIILLTHCTKSWLRTESNI